MLENLNPKEVFRFFEEICAIPHGSGNVRQISDYLIAFAKERNLWAVQDELLNVIIKKDGTAGYEDKEPVIIQGHMDMVAVKDDDCDKDLTTEGLTLCVTDEYVYAKGTSLGGDDGIAVAYALALLDSRDIPHPPLEVVITVDEEVGMDGAIGIDLGCLKGHRLLNIDSENEGELTVSCAGGVTVTADWEVSWEQADGDACAYVIELNGLTGGHSGVEIHKKRANANKLITQVLYLLERELDLHVSSIVGGTRDNVIPNSAVVRCFSKAQLQEIEGVLAAMEDTLKNEYKETDPGLSLTVKELKEEKEDTGVLETDELLRLLAFFLEVPDGVQAMCVDLPGLVETSLNFGTLRLSQESGVKAGFLLRSSSENARKELFSKVRKLIRSSDGRCTASGEYPCWEYRKNSPLRDKMVALYQEQYGSSPKVLSIHAGLECGVLSKKIKDLDAVSFGPDMLAIHTTGEKLSIASTERVWEYLKALLKEL